MTVLGSYSLMLFEISVQEDSAPVTPQPHRINPTSVKQVDATFNH